MLAPFWTKKKNNNKFWSTDIGVQKRDTLTRKILNMKEVAKSDFTPWAPNSSGSTHSQERGREMDS